MENYRRKPHGGRLIMTDISAPDFDPTRTGIPLAELMYEMHAIDREGRVYRGVDAFRVIWQALPSSALYGAACLLVTLPGFRFLARLAYRCFARIRKYLPKTHAGCTGDVCRRGRGGPPS
jgi:predicted DCC family thiol-disulfide oxidoreductase YuxK